MSVYDILSRGKHSLPRRVVLIDNETLADKTQHPTLPECHILSSIVECVRKERHEPIYSRNPVTLITQCVTTDMLHCDTWLALCDDIDCDIITQEHISIVFECHPERIVGFYTALVHSKNIIHATAVARVLAYFINVLPQGAKDHLSTTLVQAGQGIQFIENLLKLVKTLPLATGLRERAIRAFGRTLFSHIDVARAFASLVIPDNFSHPLTTDTILMMLASPHTITHIIESPTRCLDILRTVIPGVPVPRRGPYLQLVVEILKEGVTLENVHKDEWMNIVRQALRDGTLAEHGLSILKMMEPPTTLLGLVLRHIN